ncbi:MAG: hypothetical protein WKG00_12825 [Polyangiaceae bacterium]
MPSPRSAKDETDTVGLELVVLAGDHPGFNDPAYRARRNAIARLAIEHRGEAPSNVEYTEDEHAVWRTVWKELAPSHQSLACRESLEGLRSFGFDRDAIPSFAEVNAKLGAHLGFELAPVAGLVEARCFMERLATRRFLATQYVRHGSRPLYTPEPDVIHEYIGHVGALCHPATVELNLAFGRATAGVTSPDVVEKLIRIYWYVLEFGLVEEDGEPKALGAGLLSSFGELRRFRREAELLPWDLDRIAATAFDPTDYQRTLFVAPSFTRMRDDVCAWLGEAGEGRPPEELAGGPSG